jgi:hypothetical protein
MKSKENTEENIDNRVDEIIDEALNFDLPPVYRTAQIDGVVVKTYTFLNGRVIDEAAIKRISKEYNYLELAAYKGELEKQLELNSQYFMGQYNVIKPLFRQWLTTKFKRGFNRMRTKTGSQKKKFVESPRELTSGEHRQLVKFTEAVSILLYRNMCGFKIQQIQKELKQNPFYPTRVIIKFEEYQHEIIFNLDGLTEYLKPILDNFEQVTSRSVDLYFDYLNVTAHLYELDLDSLLNEVKNPKRKYKHTEPQRVKMVIDAYEQEGINLYEEAFQEVKKWTGEQPFPDYNNFNAARNYHKKKGNI